MLVVYDIRAPVATPGAGEPEVVSRSVLFLVSDDAEHVTGAALDVAAGANAPYTA